MCKGPEAAVSLVCLNNREEAPHRGWRGGAKGESRGYEGREVTSHWEEPGLYPESSGEPWENEEQKRDKVRCAFLESPLGDGLKGAKSGIWETGCPGK